MDCKKINCQMYLDCLNDYKKYYKFNILKNLAPLLISEKPIHLFCFKNDFKFKDKILSQIGDNFDNLENIKYEIIPSTNDTIKILFYNIRNLNSVLNNTAKLNFLESLGHRRDNDYMYYINFFVKNLRNNIIPPEIGIFFGYPVKDVIGYIGHPSLKKSEVNGWTFYGNPDISRKTAEKFNQAQKAMIEFCLMDKIKLSHLIESFDDPTKDNQFFIKKNKERD